jgi:hypothetical protein
MRRSPLHPIRHQARGNRRTPSAWRDESTALRRLRCPGTDVTSRAGGGGTRPHQELDTPGETLTTRHWHTTGPLRRRAGRSYGPMLYRASPSLRRRRSAVPFMGIRAHLGVSRGLPGGQGRAARRGDARTTEALIAGQAVEVGSVQKIDLLTSRAISCWRRGRRDEGLAYLGEATRRGRPVDSNSRVGTGSSGCSASPSLPGREWRRRGIRAGHHGGPRHRAAVGLPASARPRGGRGEREGRRTNPVTPGGQLIPRRHGLRAMAADAGVSVTVIWPPRHVQAVGH